MIINHRFQEKMYLNLKKCQIVSVMRISGMIIFFLFQFLYYNLSIIK